MAHKNVVFDINYAQLVRPRSVGIWQNYIGPPGDDQQVKSPVNPHIAERVCFASNTFLAEPGMFTRDMTCECGPKVMPSLDLQSNALYLEKQSNLSQHLGQFEWLVLLSPIRIGYPVTKVFVFNKITEMMFL